MDIGRTEGKPMVSPRPAAPDTAEQKLPMAHQKQGLSRRIQIGLAKLGLMTAVATGAAHHVDPNIGGPVGAIGTIPDAVGSAAVDTGIKTAEFAAKTGGDLVATVGNGIVKLADSEPQQAQDEIIQARKDAENLFKPDSASVDGQVQINFADLSHAITISDLTAIKLGDPYENIDVSNITAVDKLPAVPGSLVVVDNPVEVNITGVGLGKFYTVSIETAEGEKPILIPESFARVTKPGKLEKLSSIQDDEVLNKLNTVRVVNPTP